MFFGGALKQLVDRARSEGLWVWSRGSGLKAWGTLNPNPQTLNRNLGPLALRMLCSVLSQVP